MNGPASPHRSEQAGLFFRLCRSYGGLLSGDAFHVVGIGVEKELLHSACCP